MERIVALESNSHYVKAVVDDLATALKDHINSEDGIALAVQEVSIATKQNTATMDRMANTLDTLAVQGQRVRSLEEWRGRVDPHLEKAHERLDEASEKVNRLYWLAGLAAVVIPAIWAILLHFQVL
jgi:methyl-accepting chemotaxis protein